MLPDPDDELHNGEKFIEDTEHLYDCLDEHDDDDEDDESEGNIETEEQGWRRSQ